MQTRSTPPPESSLRSPVLVAALVAAGAGACIAAQGKINAELADAGAGAIMSSWVSFVGTLVTVVIVLIALGRWGRTIRILRERGAWWWFAIGLCGMPIVIAMASGVPIIGIALASVCSVGGQTLSGIVLDSRGVGVASPIAMTVRRLWSAACAIAGLLFSALAGPGPDAGSWTRGVLAAVFLFLGGLILTGQNSGNGVVTARSGDPIIAGLTSVTGGFVAMTLILGVDVLLGDSIRMPSAAGQWWMYAGGPLGAVITVAMAWAVRHLGALVMTLTVVGGQMVMAVIIDVGSGVGTSWATGVAIAALAASVFLSMSRPHRAES